ncbi:MAG: hypothetical protein NVS9B10_17410 [Nevskia sp.]
MKLDDSVLEYALYDVLNEMGIVIGSSVVSDELRSRWRATALRRSDLPAAIGMLVDSGSLVEAGPGERPIWTVTAAGYARVQELADVAPRTMADQVARSVLKTLRDQASPGALAPWSGSLRRRSLEAREQARLKLDQRAG